MNSTSVVYFLLLLNSLKNQLLSFCFTLFLEYCSYFVFDSLKISFFPYLRAQRIKLFKLTMPKKLETNNEEQPRRSSRLNKTTTTITKTIEKKPASKLNKETVKKVTKKVEPKVEKVEDAPNVKNFFELEADDINNKPVNFSKYSGKVILVVNVASKCGHTKAHYSQLEPLYKKYSEKGFEILAFPCSQFGYQEFKTNPEICEFVKKYDVSFPLFDKVKVNGPTSHPVFKYLKTQIPGDIKWNFGKYLIDKQGKPFNYYISKIKPNELEDDIQTLLKQ